MEISMLISIEKLFHRISNSSNSRTIIYHFAHGIGQPDQTEQGNWRA